MFQTFKPKLFVLHLFIEKKINFYFYDIYLDNIVMKNCAVSLHALRAYAR